MTTKPKLAIVIPAYKDFFLEKTLLSISNQTCKDFTLYIGDDASPNDIKSVVNKFTEKIKVVYHRFDSNLGGKDLVAHWERCIDLTAEEEWIWLFSDDDKMGEDCIQKFYDLQQEQTNYDIYHYNVQYIDENDDDYGDRTCFDDIMTSEDIFLGRMKRSLQTTAVEYLFRKDYYDEVGKFEHFDLAWGSDDAMWIKLGKKRGIKTIPDATVYWRRSRYNISNNRDNAMIYRKQEARLQFIDWIVSFHNKNQFTISTDEIVTAAAGWYFKFLKSSVINLTYKEIRLFVQKFNEKFNSYQKKDILIDLFLHKIKEYIKLKIKRS